MAHQVIMPKQGLQMTEGTITKWIVPEGGTVKKGEPLFSMETDKLAITIDSQFDGVLLKIVRKEWETVPITELIAIIGREGEDISSLLKSVDTPNEKDTNETTASVIAAPVIAAKLLPVANATERASSGRIFISPRAKKLTQDHGIDYSVIVGSGKDGMIVERDVLPYLTVKATAMARQMAGKELYHGIAGIGDQGRIYRSDLGTETEKMIPVEEDTIVPIAGMRRAVCENMMASVHQLAQANHKIRIDMSEAVKIRSAFKKRNKTVSYNDIVIMAVSRGLKEMPFMNAVSDEKFIYQKHQVHLGVAVAVENGLIVPTLRNADLLSLSQIHEQTGILAQKAKNGILTKEEYSGGTFTITNLGMFGLDEFVAIINPPQAGILAVGAIVETPVVVDGTIVIRPIMTTCLTYDHRVVDGAPAAKFLCRIKELLENPYLFLVD